MQYFQSLARLGAEVTGIDPSHENVAVASAHSLGDPLTRGIKYEAATAEELEARGKHDRGLLFFSFWYLDILESCKRSVTNAVNRELFG